MSIESKKSFIMAERLKRLREEKGLSHDKLSKALCENYGVKISSDSLINYEVTNENHTKAYKNQGMRVEYLRCFADFYGVSADYLLGITEVMTPDITVQEITQKTGLSEAAIAHIEEIKRCFFLDGITGLNMMLENNSFGHLAVQVYRIAQAVEEAKERRKEEPFLGMKVLPYSVGGAKWLEDLTGDKLTEELWASYPELKGRIHVLYGSAYIEERVRHATDRFKAIVEAISDSAKYCESAYTMKASKSGDKHGND